VGATPLNGVGVLRVGIISIIGVSALISRTDTIVTQLKRRWIVDAYIHEKHKSIGRKGRPAKVQNGKCGKERIGSMA